LSFGGWTRHWKMFTSFRKRGQKLSHHHFTNALQDIFTWVLPLQTAEVPPENDRLKYHHEIVWLLKAHTTIDKSRYVHLILQPSLFTYFILFPCPWKHQQIDFRETNWRKQWFSPLCEQNDSLPPRWKKEVQNRNSEADMAAWPMCVDIKCSDISHLTVLWLLTLSENDHM